MYKYSQVKDADPIIEEHLEQIIRTAIEHEDWDENTMSLYLFGSYGKGEGGFVSGNPVNDYDIGLFNGTNKIKESIEKLKLPVKVEVWMIPNKLPDSQQKFELIYGSIFLEGKDVVSEMEMESYDIPYEDAISSLNKRVLSMLVGKYEMSKEDPDWSKVMTQIGKMILALGDIVLIKRGQFSPSYRTRMVMLNDDTIFPFYTLAVYHKLFGLDNLNPDELWNLWNQVRQYFREYVINNQIKTDFSDMLCNFDERIERDTLGSLLEVLGVDKEWL